VSGRASTARRIVPLLATVLVLGATSASATTLRGDSSRNRLSGTARADRIFGGFGNDRLSGLGGADLLVGGFGADAIFGGGGNDRLRGGYDKDRLDGGPGADTISGDQDNDLLIGGPGRDRLLGGDGEDRLEGGPGADRLLGEAGDDHIIARGGGVDTAICGDGEDTVVADLTDVVDADCENVTPPEAKPEGSTRERPFTLGVANPTEDGWSLQVTSFTPDATAAVLAENQFNDPPSDGQVFSIARVRATRTAPGADSFSSLLRLRTVGSAAVVYTSFGNSCGVIPDPVSDQDVFTGGTVEGNVCWSVPSGEVGSLVLVDDRSAGERRQFWALR
jgi:RTX calcium-binding nonapeptide repeat (4 copies)